MYISVQQSFNLDKIVKAFEVGYRSLISDVICNSYSDIRTFSQKVDSIAESVHQSPVMLSHKYKAKVDALSKKADTIYEVINQCKAAIITGDYDNTVPYLSEVVDLIVLFYNECFTNLSVGFESIEDFLRLNIKYIDVRNALSHPASKNISIEDATNICQFVRRIVRNIEDRYFWFVTKPAIIKLIDSFLEQLDLTPIRFHNLQEIRFKHNKVVERESELKLISELIFGKGEYSRKSGSVVIYGHGGVGKTALVLEFLFRVLKDIKDQSLKENIEFICFFSAKEELLSFSETTKKLYVRDIRKQISSFDDFKHKLLDLLSVASIDQLIKLKGIIVIDNFETLVDDEKQKFIEFIRSIPRSLQFIITSRNEETGDDRVNLTEFSSTAKGSAFIREFSEANNLEITMSEEEIVRLLQLSKGNTLIIVLCLQMIGNHYDIENVLSDIENMQTGNIEVISDFMFKNTIAQSVDYLKSIKHDPSSVLKVISLYDVPVDLYSISKLSNVNVQIAEKICEYLSTKLVLEKRGESYQPSEFANKFIISKYLPNHVEVMELKETIAKHQTELSEKLNEFDKESQRNPLLKSIMDDWKPKNSIDKIAISEALLFYKELRNSLHVRNNSRIQQIRDEFLRLEKMTSHPYIRFQKARCLQLILWRTNDEAAKNLLMTEISKYFEEAIEITDFYYPYIKNTKSYAAIYWLYGVFLSSDTGSFYRSIKYLEDSIVIFRNLGIIDKAYFDAVNNLSWGYHRMYLSEGNTAYRIELEKLYTEMIQHRNKYHHINFNFAKYARQFNRYAT